MLTTSQLNNHLHSGLMFCQSSILLAHTTTTLNLTQDEEKVDQVLHHLHKAYYFGLRLGTQLKLKEVALHKRFGSNTPEDHNVCLLGIKY